MEHVIKSIDAGSPLEHKARAGDAVAAINGHMLQDVLDYKFYAYDSDLQVELRHPDGTTVMVHLRKPEGGDLGVEFETYLMDRPRSCANRCVFCFIDQLPPGMRKTMYFKDDDARLSFLMGNYITLTNLSPREVRRICELHISPVNVSVHTTDRALRCRMLNNPRAGQSLEIMEQFAKAGIVMNCQIVCCPGFNDGTALENTMRDLAAMAPAVHSVSVVPVGLTRYRQGLTELQPFTPQIAGETIDRVERFADTCLKKLGTRLFFCSDELYLKAGRPLPPDEYYEEHTQLENGVGMIRLLETEFRSALALSDEPDGHVFSIATGTAAAPCLRNLLSEARETWHGLHGTVFPVENRFFGSGVNVAGLITGRDLIDQLKGKRLGRRLLISSSMLRREEQDFLDDITLEQASRELGVPIWPVEQDGFALWDAMAGFRADSDAMPSPCDREDTEYYRYNP